MLHNFRNKLYDSHLERTKCCCFFLPSILWLRTLFPIQVSSKALYQAVWQFPFFWTFQDHLGNKLISWQFICYPRQCSDSQLPVVCLPQAGVPSSVTQCGLLDLVRSIVGQTIANVGVGTGAQSFFAAGDAQRALGKYKAAYTLYRQAFKAAGK